MLGRLWYKDVGGYWCFGSMYAVEEGDAEHYKARQDSKEIKG
jgi:hypothetical protein